MVGGGGLIQLPALFLFLPPAASNSIAAVFGTNKMSSICGTGMAVIQYARRVITLRDGLIDANNVQHALDDEKVALRA